MDTLNFQNKDYKLREIELPGLGGVLISTVSLNNAIMNNGSDYISGGAKSIDEEIYFFVEEDEIDLNEVDIVKIVSSQAV